MHDIYTRGSRAQRRASARRTARIHSFSRIWRRAVPAAIAVAILPLAMGQSARAVNPANTWNSSNGNWNTATSWSAGVVPNGSGGVYYAVINPAGGSDNLTHSSSTGAGGIDLVFSLDNEGLLNLSGGVLSGSQANSASTFVNNGAANIIGGTLANFTISGTPLGFNASGGNMLDTDIFQSSFTLNGGFARILNSLTMQTGSSVNIDAGGILSANTSATITGEVKFTDGNGSSALATEGNDALTLAAGSLVHGVTGQVGVSEFVGGTGTIVNHGTISSDGGGIIAVNPAGGTTSDGTLQAKNGSTLRLDDAVDSTGGTMNIQDTSQILVNSVPITGGTVTGAGHMTFSNSAANVLTGVLFSGAMLDLTNGNFAGFANTLTLTGGSVATLAQGGRLVATTSSTLTGEVKFTDGNGSNSLATDGGDALTLATGSLVHGVTGQIGVSQVVGGSGTIVNHGTISSDSGGIIAVNPAGGTTSDGTLQAKNGSTLRLDDAVDSTGGTMNIQDTSQILVNSVPITGGTVTGAGHMTFSNSAANVLTGVTFNGATLDLTNGNFAGFANTLTLTGGSVATIAQGGRLDAMTSATLSGEVKFTDGNGSNALSVESSDQLTLAAGSLVHGVNGQVGLAQLAGGAGTIINQGTISSDGGGIIALNPAGGTTNDGGVLEAKKSGSAGSTLQLNTAVVNTNGGSMNAADSASAIFDNSVPITGGTVTGAGRMIFSNSAANVLTGVTFNGATLDLTNGNFAGFANTLTLTGGSVATLAQGGRLDAMTSATLGGEVKFTDGNGSNALGIEGANALTLASGSLVHGVSGQVGEALFTGGLGTIANNGTISSDSGGTIALNPAGGTTNNGTLQAKNGSILRLDDAVNSAGGTMNIQDTAQILDNGQSITDGTVTGAGHMIFSNNGANLLTGVTFNGATLDLTNGNIAGYANTLTLTGGSVATLAQGGRLDAMTSATLSGEVKFTDGNGSNALGIEGASTLTLASGSLVHGSTGQVGEALSTGGASTLANNGAIKSDAGGLITLNSVNVDNGAGGTIAAAGGALTVTPVLSNAGTVMVASGSTMTASAGEMQTSGVTQVDGTFTVNAAPITLSGGELAGTGTINGNNPNVVNNGGTVKPGDSPGKLTISGDYNQASGGNLLIEFDKSSAGLLAVTGTATLGGTLDVSYLGPANSDGNYLINAGDPGSTFNFLSYGTLSNSDIGSLFSNEYSVGGSYFINGVAEDNVGANPAVYQLTQNVSSKTLALTLTNAAAPEPSAWVSLGLGILGLGALGLRARRRSVRA